MVDHLPKERFSVSSDEKNKIISAFSDTRTDKNSTEEEFQNFVHRVTEVEKIVKQLASDDIDEQQRGMILADKLLKNDNNVEITEIGKLKVKNNRTIINKLSLDDADPKKMSQESFKRYVEKDAQVRAEDRKARNERAETYKRIGNAAFKQNDYEKAITYFSKALEQRKDSSVLWNNRAITFMKLNRFEKALLDCEWALKISEANIKALLNSAKCHKCLGNDLKCTEFIALAREKNPRFLGYILEFQKNLELESENYLKKESIDSMID